MKPRTIHTMMSNSRMKRACQKRLAMRCCGSFLLRGRHGMTKAAASRHASSVTAGEREDGERWMPVAWGEGGQEQSPERDAHQQLWRRSRVTLTEHAKDRKISRAQRFECQCHCYYSNVFRVSVREHPCRGWLIASYPYKWLRRFGEPASGSPCGCIPAEIQRFIYMYLSEPDPCVRGWPWHSVARRAPSAILLFEGTRYRGGTTKIYVIPLRASAHARHHFSATMFPKPTKEWLSCKIRCEDIEQCG